MRHGEYIGEDVLLKGRRGLIRDDPESASRGILVQFDDYWLGKEYSHAWRSYYNYEFKYDEEEAE